MESSFGGICLVSDNESLLGLPWPASTSPSDDRANAVVPGDDANSSRRGEIEEEDAERLFPKIPIGWSNLQLGPNLQIP
ncbi:hypothetical protein CRG98_046136 [Punica granatum]|uniref:Uncharacterized protein n=1 Tax=Punica granatum TaxID=22663 RepID=A0A2I0HP25_PUNGR|nr:hypothetical protein CRG98_046136 [Punica granatum]